jgi:hypothetical protein
VRALTASLSSDITIGLHRMTLFETVRDADVVAQRLAGRLAHPLLPACASVLVMERSGITNAASKAVARCQLSPLN